MVLDSENDGIIISFRLFYVHSYAFVFLTTTVWAFYKRRTIFFILCFYSNIYLQKLLIVRCLFFAMKTKKMVFTFGNTLKKMYFCISNFLKNETPTTTDSHLQR